MTSTSDPTLQLRDIFARHAKPGEGVSLAQMVDPAWSGFMPDPDMLALLIERHAVVAPFLHQEAATLAPLLRDQLVRWVQARNQFIELDAGVLAELEVAFRQRLEMLAQCLSSPATEEVKAEGVREAFRVGQRALAVALRKQLGREPREVPNHEYSPELQLRLFGLALETVVSPVLDIGCGAHANLVYALRGAGHTAQGIDRAAPAGAGARVDWKQFAFIPDYFGTILSHQAFSLHFLHHELGKEVTAFTYAKIYMAILRALRVGGVFAYTPGLPFIESHLSAKSYRCERIALPAELRATPMLRAIEEYLGCGVAYAARIYRLA